MGEDAAKRARRRRSKQERRRVVEESFEPGVSVAGLARRHRVHANQIYLWRKLYREGLLADDAETPETEWLAVRLADVARQEAREAPNARAGGLIEIELPRGRVRVEGAAEAATLRLVLELLRA